MNLARMDKLKIRIGSAPAPIAQCMGWLAERAGLAGGHFRLWRRLGYPRQILDGPFAGMRYLPTAAGSAIVPKWIGVYELELHPVLDRWSASNFDLVIDVGAADGYYAVGLARKYKTRALCYDTSAYARDVLKQIAGLNQIHDRVQIRGECGKDELIESARQAKRPLIIIDCEGYEAELFDQRVIDAIPHASLIIETHDFFVPCVTRKLHERFSKSHRVSEINIAPRETRDVMRRYGFSEDEAKFAMEEGRKPDAAWLVIEPRHAS